jgi:hypothetical protein
MATAFPTTPALLKRGIEHVCYEYANLISAAHWSVHGQASWRTHANDAFLLGYRKLRDFLLKPKRSKYKLSTGQWVENPDILASDYLPLPFTRTWTLPLWETEWKQAMDKQLAHISFDREKEWDHMKWVLRLEGEMRTAWADFLAAVDPKYKPEFEAQIAHCRSKPGFSGLGL